MSSSRSSQKDSSSNVRSREDRERERLARRSGNTQDGSDRDRTKIRDSDRSRDPDRDRERVRERERSPRGSRDRDRERRRRDDERIDSSRKRDESKDPNSSSSHRGHDRSQYHTQATSRVNNEPLDMNLDYGRPDEEDQPSRQPSRNRDSKKDLARKGDINGSDQSRSHREDLNRSRDKGRRDDFGEDRSSRGVKFDDAPSSSSNAGSKSRIESLSSQSRSKAESDFIGHSKGSVSSSSNPVSTDTPLTSSSSTPSASKSILKRSPSPEIDYELEFMSKEEREERLVEERRKKRQQILEKYQNEKKEEEPVLIPPKESIPQGRRESITGPDTSGFSLEKSNQNPHSVGNQDSNSKEISAADYDPSKDRESDAIREEQKLGHTPFEKQSSGNEALEKKLAAETGKDGDEDEWEEIEVEEDEDDVEDMFALCDDDGEEKKKKTKMIRVRKGEKRDENDKKSKTLNPQGTSAHGLSDNWDDADGYYRVTLGERMGEGGRYQVSSILGRGMFSEVVRAKDTRSLDNNKEVAIKIVRIQESMYKAGLKEISILKKLKELDPNDKKHLIQLENHFDFKGHLCLVFENLNMNLRELIKRFGKDVGINLRAVRTYCHQMFLALSLLKKANFMHADIKPDNILVDESKTTLKVCDLGSASHVDEMEITPYLVSRFYRAPEIILGAPYDPSLDVWSIGCTLYELFTGKILFPGRSNNQMLLLMQELKGKITNKQLRKSKFSKQHFDEETNVFLSRERDRTTGADVVRKITINKPSSDLRSRILPPETQKSLSEEDLRLTLNFVDLLNKTLELDPNKRITPNAALSHPFCTG